MKINIGKRMRVENLWLEPGDYEVSVDQDSNHVVVSNSASIHELKATQRPRKLAVTRSKAQLQQTEDKFRWLLRVCKPPGTEWVVVLYEN